MGQTPGGTLELIDAATGVRAAAAACPARDRSPFLNQVEAFAARGRPATARSRSRPSATCDTMALLLEAQAHGDAAGGTRDAA